MHDNLPELGLIVEELVADPQKILFALTRQRNARGTPA